MWEMIGKGLTALGVLLVVLHWLGAMRWSVEWEVAGGDEEGQAG